MIANVICSVQLASVRGSHVGHFGMAGMVTADS